MATSDTPGQSPASQDSFLQAINARASTATGRGRELRGGRVICYVVLAVLLAVGIYALMAGRDRSFGAPPDATGVAHDVAAAMRVT